MVAKSYVYKVRCQGVRPNIRGFEAGIKLFKSMEKYATVQAKILSKFMKKWSEVELAGFNSYVAEYIDYM